MSKEAAPPLEPGCTCRYVYSNGFWALVINRRCPVHGLPDEDYPGKND